MFDDIAVNISVYLLGPATGGGTKSVHQFLTVSAMNDLLLKATKENPLLVSIRPLRYAMVSFMLDLC